MNEIKVSVSYEKPTTSKFDALMAEYEVAKKVAEETVSYYKPLADAAENAKFDAIMEQLETIKEYAVRISQITGKAVWITAYISSSLTNYVSEKFSVIYRPNQTVNKWEIRSEHREFNKNHIAYYTEYGHNFIGEWDKWKVYQKLEENACNQLEQAIKKQKDKAQHQINRLNNITK